jgi:hypothetical protein
LADVRKRLDDVDLAAELDRMVEQPDVHLRAELDQRKLTSEDERFAMILKVLGEVASAETVAW